MARSRPIPQPDAEEARKASLIARLEQLGASLVRTRKEAVDARAQSGIEEIWREDEEHYEGIDELNKGETGSNKTKPPFSAVQNSLSNPCTEFLNITKPYVEMAAAKVGDILLPTDEPPWSLKETPVPEMLERAKGGLPLNVIKGMAEAGVSEQIAVEVANTEKQHYESLIEQAREKAKKASKRIQDWHVEGQWHAEMRKVMEDCAKLGSGVIKGPVPVSKRAQMFKDGELVLKEEIKPVSKHISVWNFFPDGACGESIHNGAYCWERDFITPKQLMEMKGNPDYIGTQIEKCLTEGPRKVADVRKTSDGRDVSNGSLFEIWYYYGYATREDLDAAGCKCKKDSVMIPAMMTMVNDHVVKAVLNPLDTGDFPYDVMPWARRKNMPWGSGVARSIRAAQRFILGASRSMMTNAGRAAGPILAMRAGMVTAADGNEDITPWKQYWIGESDTTDDVRKAIAWLEIPDRQQALMNIIQFGLKMAEDVTGLPLLMQGQQGSAPETLGGQQLVDRNASGVLRRIARTFDDCITEPHVRRYYAWLLQYGDDEEKGEFVVDARGSTALVERDINKQEVNALLQAALNPAFGLDPKKTMAEKLRADNRNPKDFQYTEAQEKQMAEQQAQAQAKGDPRTQAALQVAQVRSEGEKAKATLVQASDMAELQFKAKEAERQRQHEMSLAARQERIELIKLASVSNTSVAEIKAQLAGKVMQLRTQKELAAVNRKAPQVATPAVEPPGRAPEGQAFQR